MKSYSNSRMAELIAEYIHSDRDRKILTDRFINGLTYAELAEKHYLSERQIKRIIKKGDSLLITLL